MVAPLTSSRLPSSLQQGKFGCAGSERNVLIWLHYVEDNVKSASAENFESLKACLSGATFSQSDLSPQVQAVINGVQQVVQERVFDPNLHQKVQAAIRGYNNRS